MPMSELGRYRLARLGQNVNTTVDALLNKEETERRREELMRNRRAVMQTVGEFVRTPATGREDIYNRSTRAAVSLIPYGEEGQRGARLINETVANYARLNPQFAPKAPAKRVTEWIDATETKDEKRYPLRRQVGNEIQTLQQQVDESGRPTGLFKYGNAGNVSVARIGRVDPELKKQEAIKKRIAQITAKNQGLGQLMLQNSSKTNAAIAGLKEDDPAYKASVLNIDIVNSGLAQQIRDNEALLEDLNSQIGGTYKAGQEAAPAIEQSDGMLTKDTFIQEFEKDYGRKPTDSELTKAKGKHYQ